MCIYCITPLAKGLCDTPLVLLTLKFHDLHPFLIYTPTPSVYTHPTFNCVIIRHFAEMDIEVLLTFNCTMCRRKSILTEDLFKLNELDLQVFDEDFDHWVNID